MKKTVAAAIALSTLLIISGIAVAEITITDIVDSPDPVTVNSVILIDCNASGNNGTEVDTVIIEIDPPNSSAQNFSMNPQGSSIYRYSYTPSENGTFIYRIYANDTNGTWYASSLLSFVSVPVGYDPTAGFGKEFKDVKITIEISASCDAGITFYYAPAFVIRGQHVVFVMLSQNLGNLDQNETTTLTIRNPNGTALGSFIPLMGQTQISPGVLKYDTVFTSPGDYKFEFGIWDSSNYSIGNYTAIATIDWGSIFESGNVSLDWNELQSDSNCTNLTYNNDTGLNNTVCEKTIHDICKDLNIGDLTSFSTTQASSLSVADKEPNTTAYYGNATIGGSPYNGYLFNVTNCSDYCYACISPDSSINETEECGFLGDNIETNSETYKIMSINSNGSSFSVIQTIQSCSFLGHVYNCSVNVSNSTADCNQTLICNGDVSVTKIFPLIENYGNTTTPEPEPEPEPTPQPTPTPTPTPEPTPQPMPEPEPSPGSNASTGQTQVSINIEPLERDISGEQGEWVPIKFNVTNIGDVNVTDIELIPIVMEGWEIKEAKVDFIDVGETLNRTIFVKPPIDAALAKYVIPVRANRGNLTLDMDYVWFTVLEAGNRTRLEILEAPGTMGIVIDSEIDVPILIKNTGKIPLHKIKAELQNAETCISGFNFTTIDELGVNETMPMTLKMKSVSSIKKCDSTLIISSEEKSYAFTDIQIQVVPGPGLLPEMPTLMYFPMILIILLGVLMKMKKSREAMEMEPGIVGTIANLLMFVLIMVVIYLVAGYLEFVPLF